MIRILKKISVYLFMLVTIALPLSAEWLFNTFDGLTMEEVIFHLKVPMVGANNDFLMEYITDYFLKALFIFFVIITINHFLFKIFKNKSKYRSFLKLTIGLSFVLLFVTASTNISREFEVLAYIKANLQQSLFFEENYVRPTNENITYPEIDRNLIYIFVESYENTFAYIEDGGALPENTLSPMSELIDSNINFSNTEKLGGAAAATGTTWTVGGLVAQTSGVHLKLPIEGNSLDLHSDFLKGNISIGEILNERNYNQTFLLGSDASFGGRRNYFEQHGNYEIKDHPYAIEQGLIPSDYFEWWGYEDEKLFEYAKAELLSLSAQDQPFNLTMLTADTHHIDGYATKGMKEPFDHQYKNVIFNTSKQLRDFILWIQEQEFYDNTTIVISGDHHTMDAPFIESNVDENYDRRIFNLFINSLVKPINPVNRVFATFDLFPSTLASMGFEIENDRLGLGTNLFSDQRTIFEEYGIKHVNKELAINSIYYNNNIISNKKN